MIVKDDLLTLASQLAEIARDTTDAPTGDKLMELVDSLLTASGLSQHGGKTPGGWRSEPVSGRW